MDAQTFVAHLLTLRGQEVEHFIGEHAAGVDDLDAAAQLLKDEAKAQETRDLDIALLYANLIMALANWTKAPGHRALALLARGNVLMRQGHHREAVVCFDAAGSDFLAVDDEIGWARTRISYLYCAPRIGLIEQAFEQAKQAHDILVRHGEYWRAFDLETNLALTLEGMGRYQEALVACDRALMVCSVNPVQQAANKARGLANKAIVLRMLGDLHGSLLCQQEARSIFAEQGQFLDAALEDYNLAVTRADLGQYSAALHLYHKALDYYQQHALPNLTALATANIADCLLHLNRASEALQLSEKAVIIYRSLDETSNLGWALIYLARAQVACRRLTIALGTLKEARQCFESVGAVATTGLVLLTLADLLLLKQPIEALAHADQALDIFRTHRMESWIAQAHLLQGRAYEALGDIDRAAALGKLACDEAHQVQIPWLEFNCECMLGRLSQCNGELLAAESHYQAALSLLEGLMTWLVRDQRSTFLADKEDVFGALIGLCLNQQNVNGGLEYLERLKSQVLREYLTRSADIRLRASGPDEARLLNELQRLRQELHWYNTQVARAEGALQETTLTEEKQAIRGALDVAGTETTEHLALLVKQKSEQHQRERAISEILERAFLQQESSRFAAFPTSGLVRVASLGQAPISVEHLAEVLPAGGALLEYFLEGDDLLIFTLHAQQRCAEVTRVPGAVSRLNRLLPLFRANIDLVAQQVATQPADTPLDSALEANAQALSSRLYEVLLRPVERHIPQDGRLLIVPYGPLHTLPFHALQSESGYLIEQCEIAYLPAASMLLLQESLSPARQARPHQQNRALVLGHSHGGALPHALREAQQVAALLNGNCYLEEQATIERLNSTSGSYTIIHLAAHGKNRSDAPDFSYLQLADGQLNTVDVFNLDLPAELVTLSGCETGLVVIGGGDELLGLGRGFLYAGARSLLISLWRVGDASTAQLMEQFYQGLLSGLSRAGALRAAQRAFLSAAREDGVQAIWTHPYFWAPFRLLGSAGPIAF